MRALGLALALIATPAMGQDHRSIDVPVAYQGTWALNSSFCSDASGPAIVRIGPRTLSFYEESGYLSLAQLNEVSDPPEFFGRFAFVHNLSFFEQTIRLRLASGKLFIDRNATADDEPSGIAWTKCPADQRRPS